jgi:TIR domain
MLKLFISYSHKDESYRQELDNHFAVLKREGQIEVWHDRCFELGDRVHRVINKNLEAADIVLFLVSANFLASDYCYTIEMPRTLERDRQGSVKILPVILRQCDWRNAPFGDISAMPRDGKSIESFSSHDDAYMEVVAEIRKAIALSSSAQIEKTKDVGLGADGDHELNPEYFPKTPVALTDSRRRFYVSQLVRKQAELVAVQADLETCQTKKQELKLNKDAEQLLKEMEELEKDLRRVE